MRANLNWVTNDLAVGGDLDGNDSVMVAQVLEIIDLGITHVVDLRIEDDDTQIWEAAQISYLSVGTTDAAGHVVAPEVFDKGVRFARLAVRNGGKVLAHCHMGINRGPSMGFAILLDRGHSPIEAFDMIRAARPQAFIAYAQDALAAHVARQLRKGGRPADPRRQARALQKHIDEVLTPSTVGRIRHVMRQNHRRDLGFSA
ncbi:dual specificity protein phosphatase family protein [Paeniglutamicibacter sp. ABSL32-1]|uniref:protein-tyrosine phosphatase family protein n=1 Tax=Paeniglutamicibacter quisquiliarum TaxID=2849498 RepID=UPI001C2DC893|nr:dual specificity protein phosphatase [Paeniglutamicibacter quisquiliarum]MBV1777811.1 dual specificity protein phosphatase family protein [Paeniglutamicibacter quisquiliarum]